MPDVRCLRADHNTQWVPDKCGILPCLRVLAPCAVGMPHSLLGCVPQHSPCDLPTGAVSFVRAGPEPTVLWMLSNPELVLSQGLPEHPVLPPATEILPTVAYCSRKKLPFLTHF